MLTGQSLDSNLQLRWELFLDSLFFHSSGCILYLSIMENEQCKPRTNKLSLSEAIPYTELLYLVVAGTTHNIPAHSCLLPLLSCCIKHDIASVTAFYCWFAGNNSMGYWSSMDSCSFLFYSIPGDISYFQCML